MAGRTFKPTSSMLATLIANRNAVLIFTQASGGFTTDPETGNQIPETTTLRFEATAKSTYKPDDATQQFFDGKDNQSQWFGGRIVIPLTIPSFIKHLTKGRMQLGIFDSDGVFTENRAGSIVLYNPHQNIYTGDALGTKYMAVFVQD